MFKDYIRSIKKSFKLKHYINYIVIFAVLLLFTSLYYAGALNRSIPSLLNQIGYSVILAVSLNLVVGFLGELSLGHAGFMCVGAYLGTLVSNGLISLGINTVLAILIAVAVGGAVSGVFGLIVGLPALRLRGDYLAIVTLAFGEIVRNICRNLPFFGGAKGLQSESYSALNSDKSFHLFILTFILVLFMLAIIQNLIRSKHGRAITAIRDNEIAAKVTGINVTFYKLLVFVVSAVFAGVAGVIYGASVSPVEYGTFSYNYSIEILVMVVLGGMGSLNGSIIAATVITALNFYLKAYLTGEVKTLIYAVILIVMVVYKNAPALKSFREKYNLKNLRARIFRAKHDPAAVADDEGAWDKVPTKIDMNEVLSLDMKVTESTVKPDKEGK